MKIDIVAFSGCIAFITSFIGLLPQMLKAWQTRSTQDISMLMLVNYAVCSLAWIIYGQYTSSLAVTASNVIGLLTSLALIIQKKYYDARAI